MLHNKSGDVGIWHEAYKVRAGEYECVCGGVASLGFASASITGAVNTSVTGAAEGHLD